MIAIIDSGSTKADWIFTDGVNEIRLNTPGMNPNFINEDGVLKILNKEVLASVDVSKLKKIFYFGTGCSGDLQKKVISDTFSRIFINSEIHVDHDIMGAAIATCGNQAGIACIIGTGSNSIYFDGNNVHENNYGLGFILADEGAGTYLGKKLITHYLYDLLPDNLAVDFKKRYNLSKADVIKNVYNSPAPNSWLGSFAEFLTPYKKDEWVRGVVKKGFEEFVNLFVINYNEYNTLPIHFVGSIAFHYSNILSDVAAEYKFNLGKIIQKPIDGLAEYFVKREY